jgi:general stress protein YciG
MEKTKRQQGFATFTPEKMREVASKGGKAAHASGNAYHWNTETARSAGEKGGKLRHQTGHSNPERHNRMTCGEKEYYNKPCTGLIKFGADMRRCQCKCH